MRTHKFITTAIIGVLAIAISWVTGLRAAPTDPNQPQPAAVQVAPAAKPAPAKVAPTRPAPIPQQPVAAAQPARPKIPQTQPGLTVKPTVTTPASQPSKPKAVSAPPAPAATIKAVTPPLPATPVAPKATPVQLVPAVTTKPVTVPASQPVKSLLAPAAAVKTAQPTVVAKPAPVQPTAVAAKPKQVVAAQPQAPVAAKVATTVSAQAKPAAPTSKPAIDPKVVEGQLTAVQAQLVAGNVDAASKAMQLITMDPANAALTARLAFVTKLADLGKVVADPNKMLPALSGAFTAATTPDETAACWQVALGAARKAVVANKESITPVVDFMGKTMAPAMHKVTPFVDVASLNVALRSVGAAEAQLRAAASQTGTAAHWAAWVAGVNQLAGLVDGGLSPQAASDLFDRMYADANSRVAKGAIELAKGRFLLGRGLLASVPATIDRAMAGVTSDDEILSIISLNYDLALALEKSGNAQGATAEFTKAEKLVESRPPSVAIASVRARALLAFGQPAQAAETYWKAVGAAKLSSEREQMLSSYASAAQAAGHGPAALTRLKSALASPTVYISLAASMAQSGNTAGALGVLDSVTPQDVTSDPAVASRLTAVMQQIAQQRRVAAQNQGAKCRAIAAAFDAAAKAGQKAGDANACYAGTEHAAAFRDIAAQVEK